MTAAVRTRKETESADLVIGYGLLICGFVYAGVLVATGRATFAISRLIYIQVDLPAFCVAAAIAAFCMLLYRANATLPAWSDRLRLAALRPWHIALAALVAMVAAVGPVYHGFTFSMDEYMTTLQAEIFAAGRLAGEVPAGWQDVGRALNHGFARYDAASGQVYSAYRPGMAALYALFDLVGLGRYTSAVISAGSIVLVASVARRLWPRSDTAPVVAALLVATSQQVLVTGLTAYAMPAHLFFNLLWLRLFLMDRIWAHGLAALVGVATAALHQVHPHLFFAAPFLLTLLRPFRPGPILLYGTIYAAGHLLVIGWDQIALGTAATTDAVGSAGSGFMARLDRMFRVPGPFQIATVSALVVRFFAWQNLVLLPLIVVAVRRAAWPRPLKLLAASAAFSLLPYLLLMPDQGHGWGYRYLHGLIGNLALIATAGWLAVETMSDAGRRRIVPALVAAGVLSVVIMLPLRALQVERMVAPFAEGYAYIRNNPADVVVVDTPTIYYGQDLVRNRPFLENRPVLLDLRHLKEEQVRRLCDAYAVALVGADDVARFGLLPESVPNTPPDDYARMLDILRSAACTGK